MASNGSSNANSPASDERSVSRRGLLYTSALGTAAGVGGCLGGDRPSQNGGENTPRGDATPTGGAGDGLSAEFLAFDELPGSVTPGFSRVDPVENSPVGGSVEDWESLPTVQIPPSEERVTYDDWSGTDDCSANVSYAYDESNFYLSIDVTDDAHSAVGGSSMWKGDSIQFGFADEGSYGPEYGFGHVDGSPEIWQWHSGTEIRGPDWIDLRTTPREDGLRYEAAISWGAIHDREGPPVDGRLPFAVVVNDNDGNGRRGFLEWVPEWNSKAAANLATLGLVPEDEPWGLWIDGPDRATPGESAAFTISIPNYGAESVALDVSMPSAEVDGSLEVPADHLARVPVEVSPSETGDLSVTATVESEGTTREVTHELGVFSAESLLGRFEEIESRFPTLTSALERANEEGLPTDYQTVDATVVERFLQYGREDVEQEELERASYVADELEALIERSRSDLESALSGDATLRDPPRYRTDRPEIEGKHFEASSQRTSEDSPTERPVFFSGYGHFDTVRNDIPNFQDFGANAAQLTLPLRNTVFPTGGLYAWGTRINGGAQVTFEADDGAAHSGEQSLKLTNETEKADNTFGTVWQSVPVEPETTYEIEAWVRGENVTESDLVIDWSQRTAVPTGTYDWQKVTTERTTDADQTSLEVRIVCQAPADGLWYDDIAVRRADGGDNLLENPGFEGLASDKAYTIDEAAIERELVEPLRRAEEHDVSVNVLLSAHTMPNFAFEEWPDMKADPTGHFIEYVIDHPKAREIMEAHFRAATEKIAEFDSLHSITLSNEPAYRSQHDRWTKEQWPAYLRERYGDVGTLNDVYGADYGAFGDVPRGPNNYATHPQTYDWARFNNERFADFHGWLRDIVHEVDPEIAVHTKIMAKALDKRASLIGQGIDPEEFTAVSEINGNDNHNWPDQGVGGYRSYLADYDLQTSLMKAPVFNSENHLIRNRNDHYEPHVRNHLRTNLWQGVVHGQGASTMWIWNRTYNDDSSAAGSILHRPDCVAALGRTNLDTNRLGEEIVALQDAPRDVAILYSLAAHVFSNGYLEAANDAYAALTESGHAVDFVSDSQIRDGGLSGYECLVVPAATHVEPDTIGPIASFVEAGGTPLFVGENLLRSDPRGRDLPASERETVVDAAVSAPGPDATRKQRRSAIREEADRITPPPVTAVDAETGDRVSGIEWQAVEHDEELLVNVANYTHEPVTLEFRRDGEALSAGRERIEERSVSSAAQTIEGQTPRLFAFGLD